MTDKRRVFAFLLLLAGTLASSAAERFHCRTFADVDLQRAKRFWTQQALDQAVPMSLSFDALPGGTIAQLRPWQCFIFGRRSITSAMAASPVTDVDETIFPFSTSGRLAYIDASSTSRWCSATLVHADNLLITAAHCVRDRTGVDHTAVAFIRAYDKANMTGEFFAVRRAASDVRWVTAPVLSRDYDYAVLEIEPAASQHLALVTGSALSSFTALGYPGAGVAMKRDDGTRGKTVGLTVEMLDNRMDYGSSGGSWIGALTPGSVTTGTNEVIGINAGKTSATVTVGPLFDQNLLDLVQHVMDGCPDQEE